MSGRRRALGTRNGRVLVLGAGSAGEHFVGALRRLDPDVESVVVERELAGGECSYYACLPTKTLLCPAEVLAAARVSPGAAEAVTGELDPERVYWWRDQVTDGRDDLWHAGWLADQGAELVHGEAHVARPGVVAVDEREIEYGALVVATGSSPAVPPVPGIESVDFWRSRSTASTRRRSSSRSRRASCFRTACARAECSSDSSTTASGSRSTISASATPLSAS